jgi:hypothetical protein
VKDPRTVSFARTPAQKRVFASFFVEGTSPKDTHVYQSQHRAPLEGKDREKTKKIGN